MRKLLPLLFLAFLASCISDDKDDKKDDTVAQQQPPKAPAVKPGTITDLSVRSQPANSFSVYLPSDFSYDKQWPVVIFFDAHGDGHEPLDKYKSIADELGFIFVASNSSRNGIQMGEAASIGNGLIDEVKSLYPCADNEIILCGFSGGARVVSMLGGSPSDLKAIICNSAAPAAPFRDKIFVGLAGLGDMNYLEMKKFNDSYPANANPHELLVFDGKHEWAPVSVMRTALLITNCYKKDKSIHPVDSTNAMNALSEALISQSDSMKSMSCLLAKNLLETGTHIVTSSPGKENISKKFAAISKDPCVRSDETGWKNAEAEETVLQQELGEAVRDKDTTWWRANADSYFETKSTGAEKFMRQRLRGYTSLMLYTYSNQAMKVSNLHAAESLITIYSIVDPENSEWAYMKAALYMSLGLDKYVVPNLEKAIDLGFNDRLRLQNDPVFNYLHSDPGFNGLFARMK
ncbi:MAG TPA: hypothetical protein VFU15_05215 [Bacteroidia bacterium]|nr:hypothetical protein [Bacteroidia bacterium]